MKVHDDPENLFIVFLGWFCYVLLCFAECIFIMSLC